ncbi:MAG TPA: helix-turn-helix transcriptional regulator [Acidimicrobiales bacterium]|nr:helix-turn-helix transcriptional regulator [Acidimicrobiales bacterium]
MTTFATMLRQFRVAAALSQEALAKRCRISSDTIAALERGRRRAPRQQMVGSAGQDAVHRGGSVRPSSMARVPAE